MHCMPHRNDVLEHGSSRPMPTLELCRVHCMHIFYYGMAADKKKNCSIGGEFDEQRTQMQKVQSSRALKRHHTIQSMATANENGKKVD